MADLQKLYQSRGTEKAMSILAKASDMAKENKDLKLYEIQNGLKIGYDEAIIVMDWLSDNHEAEPTISEHWIRRARSFVLNSPAPSLAGMIEAIGFGERRAYLIMQTLVRRGIIRITDDFRFERIGRMADFKDLVRQMEVLAKKYRGRCEPALLMRFMHVDPITAIRLAQYGEEFLGLKWKGRPSHLM